MNGFCPKEISDVAILGILLNKLENLACRACCIVVINHESPDLRMLFCACLNAEYSSLYHRWTRAFSA